MVEARPIAASTFVIACNGADDAPPASAVREFLLQHDARRLTTIYHPLEPEHEPAHRIVTYERGREPAVRMIRLPSRPPSTYVFDPFVPLWPKRADCWIGFNNLAAGRGLLQRRRGPAGTSSVVPAARSSTTPHSGVASII